MSTQSVVTAIRVLEFVSEHQPVGLSEIARTLEGSKATVLRMLTTLEDLRWLQRNAVAAWSLTPHAYAVAARGGAAPSLRDIALGPMSALQLETTETVHLAVPDGDHLILAERVDTSHALRAFLAHGSRIPFHASATGLAFLAVADESVLECCLAGPLEAVTGRTRTNADELRAEVLATRERGYSVNVEGLSSGITSLGSGIFGPGGEAIGALSVSGPTSRVRPEFFAEYGTAVQRTAAEISRTLRVASAGR